MPRVRPFVAWYRDLNPPNPANVDGDPGMGLAWFSDGAPPGLWHADGEYGTREDAENDIDHMVDMAASGGKAIEGVALRKGTWPLRN